MERVSAGRGAPGAGRWLPDPPDPRGTKNLRGIVRWFGLSTERDAVMRWKRNDSV